MFSHKANFPLKLASEEMFFEWNNNFGMYAQRTVSELPILHVNSYISTSMYLQSRKTSCLAPSETQITGARRNSGANYDTEFEH